MNRWRSYEYEALSDRIRQLEELVTDLTVAEADLANAVDAALGEVDQLQKHVADLEAAVAAADVNAAQDAAVAIEAQVTRLRSALPAVAPGDNAPPAPDQGSAPDPTPVADPVPST